MTVEITDTDSILDVFTFEREKKVYSDKEQKVRQIVKTIFSEELSQVFSSLMGRGLTVIIIILEGNLSSTQDEEEEPDDAVVDEAQTVSFVQARQLPPQYFNKTREKLPIKPKCLTILRRES